MRPTLFVLLLMMFCYNQAIAQSIQAPKIKANLTPAEPPKSGYEQLVGCWFEPHKTEHRLAFKADKTFELGVILADSLLNDTNSGTYNFNGKEGWLVFKNGTRQRFLFEPNRNAGFSVLRLYDSEVKKFNKMVPIGSPGMCR